MITETHPGGGTFTLSEGLTVTRMGYGLRSTVAGRSRHADHVNVQVTEFPASQNNENA
jgi:hypothetical protein